MKWNRSFAVGLFLLRLSPGAVLAVEVSLEENKAERGNIGYVDLQHVFRDYPETQKEKQRFEDLVRQSEDQVNLRKAELIGLRAELARLRMERDFIVKTAPSGEPPALPGGLGTTASPPPALPGVAETRASSARPEAANSSATASAASGTAPGPAVSTSAAAIPTSTRTAAGFTTTASTGTAVVSPAPGAETTPADPASATGIAVSMPPVSALPGLAPEAPYPTSRLPIDAKIAETTRLLNQKEGDFKKYQSQVEQNLINLENRKTEILLGKIYKAVQNVAHDEGVSVVVDKNQILFGHKAVDLTEKVLQRLKGL